MMINYNSLNNEKIKFHSSKYSIIQNIFIHLITKLPILTHENEMLNFQIDT